MTGVLERSLAILETLAANPEGMALATLSDQLDIPRSAVHRLLAELIRFGYVRQPREQGEYVLTTKLISLGLTYLHSTGVVDLAQPILDRLANETGELIRLAVTDGDKLTWVAKAQGTRTGLRYEPETGAVVRLCCTATGHAWLLTMSDEEALELVARQGFGKKGEFGSNAPLTASALLKYLEQARARGFSTAADTYADGVAAIAAPVIRRGGQVAGVLTISGPTLRFPDERMLELAPDLLRAADELAASSAASPSFGAARASSA
ncbi:regulatory proteins, IclR [Thauera phenylacetica B4P]|uniref:Regulatory proteins, IclR n=1 Tax=Thauera phenylacetica B4P TaxID=1234382 RepID=N6ZSJ8_9RHOO|nr:IclR family transcriptional regulator [Thauera phenylacetica]ENO97452.1 regulatory proteins, IclR [Thauera phenylacetica B4P]